MNHLPIKFFRLAVIVLIAVTGTACVTYYQPRYGDDGVYFDQTRYRPSTVVVADPLLYPYWSLDYFYFSRYYHPYSVAVSAYDPWFYPYPGWYYGYQSRPNIGFGFSTGSYYPWHSFGYASYRPWRPHSVRYQHDQHEPSHRARRIDERLRAIDARGRQVRVTRPSRQDMAPALRSEAMLRHRIAEDRAAAASPGVRPSSDSTRTMQRQTDTRPVAPRRRPGNRTSRQRSEPGRSTRPQRQPPRSERQPGTDLSTPRASMPERRSSINRSSRVRDNESQ